MKTFYIPLTLVMTGCSDYGLEKVKSPTSGGADEEVVVVDEEDENPEFTINTAEVLDPPIQDEPEEEETEDPPEDEPCGNLDDDCDMDGYTPNDGDCDDENVLVHPFAGDFYGDGIDQDCDSLDCEADTFEGVYYAFCPDFDLTWSESYDLCVDSGYDSLAGIYSESIQTSINLLLQDSGEDDTERPWVNISSVGSNQWDSGIPFEYTNWAPEEPNGGAEFCGHINRNDADLGQWNDVPCDDTQWSLICEVEI